MSGANGSARPMGITILAVLALIAGVMAVLASLGMIGLGGLAAAVGAAGVGGFLGFWGLVVLAQGVADLALAYGFWMLKPWGWRLGAVLAMVGVLISLIGQVAWTVDIVGLAISVVFAVLWLYYLNQQSIREAFGAPASGLPIVGEALAPYLAKIKI